MAAISFFFFSKDAVAQPQQPCYDSVSLLIQQAFNNNAPAAMYALTSGEYQKRVAEKSFIEGTKKFIISNGSWSSLTIKEAADSGFIYLATFENEQQHLYLLLDDACKILRFNFKPVPVIKQNKNYKAGSNNKMLSATDSLVEKLVRPYIQQDITSGICLAVIQNNKITRYSYGETARENKSLPDPAASIFEIGSVTKTFTSLLLAKAVADKRMSLDDPINKYLPDSVPLLQFKDSVIRLRHLSNHTAGFPRLPANIFTADVDPADPYKHYSLQNMFSYLVSYKPTVQPGSTFAYSNYAAGLLGCLLARQHGQSFEKMIAEQITRPLKMRSTRINLRPQDSLQFVQGYNEKGKATSPWDLGPLQGSGAIRSTLDDMILYTRAQMSLRNKSLKKAMLLSHQTSFESASNRMGLGWRITENAHRQYWHHSGGTGGFRSFVGFDKKRQLAVLILSNTAVEVTDIGVNILEN